MPMWPILSGTGGTDAGSYAPIDAGFILTDPSSVLTDGRVFTASLGLSSSVGDGTFTLSVRDSQVATLSGSALFSGSVGGSSGLSGSLTRLLDGSSYLVAGPNVVIASSSNGQVT